jgi:hypothetical protein
VDYCIKHSEIARLYISTGAKQLTETLNGLVLAGSLMNQVISVVTLIGLHGRNVL